jgi:predicted metal-dependent phosphoesterase TrpH
MTTLRADLHVHTCHSRHNGTLPFLGARDCYSTPEQVYRTAKARGMDLVAITDHDSIDGALELLEAHCDTEDVIVGEEITCWLPGTGIEVHIAAYEMTESLHREVQALRANVFDVTARLREAGVLFALNHLLHFYRGQVALCEYLRLLDAVPALEVRNGTMLAAHNALAARIAKGQASLVCGHRTGDRIPEPGARSPEPGARKAAVAGSDAHTLRRVGRTWTEAPGRTREEFLASVRAGLGRAGGAHGGVGAVAGDAYGVVARYVASLGGVGSCDLRGWRRAGCAAFSVVSLPFQVTPLVVAAARKCAEARAVSRARAELAGGSESPLPSPESPFDSLRSLEASESRRPASLAQGKRAPSPQPPPSPLRGYGEASRVRDGALAAPRQ